MLTKRQNLLTITVMIGAGCNFILNILLIPKYQSIGAAIASLAAETVISVSQLIIVRREISIKKVFCSVFPYLFSSIIMFLVLQYINRFLLASFKNTEKSWEYVFVLIPGMGFSDCPQQLTMVYLVL